VLDPCHSSCCVIAIVHEKAPLCCAFWDASLTMYVFFVLLGAGLGGLRLFHPFLQINSIA